MKSRMFVPSLLVAIGLAFTPVFAADGGPHAKAIKARQGLMQVYGFSMGTLAAMAKEKMPYDAAVASGAAGNLLAAISMDQSLMWPEGSDSENAENATNRALPEIWSTYPKIAEKGKAMAEAATALNDAAGNGLEALQGAMGAAGKGCKGCHDDFRAEKK